MPSVEKNKIGGWGEKNPQQGIRNLSLEPRAHVGTNTGVPSFCFSGQSRTLALPHWPCVPVAGRCSWPHVPGKLRRAEHEAAGLKPSTPYVTAMQSMQRTGTEAPH